MVRPAGPRRDGRDFAGTARRRDYR